MAETAKFHSQLKSAIDQSYVDMNSLEVQFTCMVSESSEILSSYQIKPFFVVRLGLI